MKLELDVWYELWDRAGSQGLDTWQALVQTGTDDAKGPATPETSVAGVSPDERPGVPDQAR